MREEPAVRIPPPQKSWHVCVYLGFSCRRRYGVPHVTAAVRVWLLMIKDCAEDVPLGGEIAELRFSDKVVRKIENDVTCLIFTQSRWPACLIRSDETASRWQRWNHRHSQHSGVLLLESRCKMVPSSPFFLPFHCCFMSSAASLASKTSPLFEKKQIITISFVKSYNVLHNFSAHVRTHLHQASQPDTPTNKLTYRHT